MSKTAGLTNKSQDIIKNATFSFKVEGCSVSSETQTKAHSVLSGHKSASSVISEYSSAYKKKSITR